MLVYTITGTHPDLLADMSSRELLEEVLCPRSVYATQNGAMKAVEAEIAEYAAEQVNTLEGMQLPLTVNWKHVTSPVPVGSHTTGVHWETTNPFTEETMQVHEMVLQCEQGDI